MVAAFGKGDRGGSEISIRMTQGGQPMKLHRFWVWGDYFKLESYTAPKRGNDTLRNRQEFQRNQLTELASTDFESWAREIFDIATTIAYRDGELIGSPKGGIKIAAMFKWLLYCLWATLLIRAGLLAGG